MTNQYFLARIAGRDPSIRAADADRERIADRLRKSHAEGRLDLTEFQQRLERCYEAKTFGELDQLVKDLPRQDDPGERHASGFRPPRWRFGVLIPLLIVFFLLSAASGHHHVFWLWIPLLFVFFRLFWWRHRRWSTGTRRGPGDWI